MFSLDSREPGNGEKWMGDHSRKQKIVFGNYRKQMYFARGQFYFAAFALFRRNLGWKAPRRNESAAKRKVRKPSPRGRRAKKACALTLTEAPEKQASKR